MITKKDFLDNLGVIEKVGKQVLGRSLDWDKEHSLNERQSGVVFQTKVFGGYYLPNRNTLFPYIVVYWDEKRKLVEFIIKAKMGLVDLDKRDIIMEYDSRDAVLSYLQDIFKYNDGVSPALMGAMEHPSVYLADTGLGGIKTIHDLFKQAFSHEDNSEYVLDNVSHCEDSPFNPNPRDLDIMNLWVPEQRQYELIEQWKNQYKKSQSEI